MLTAIPQGDDTSERVGNQIRVTGYYGKFVVAAGDVTNIVRVIFYIPKSADLSLTGTTVTSLVDLDKYTILMDKYISVGTGGPSTKAFTVSKSFTKGSRLGLDVQFDGTFNNDYAKNPVKMYIVSDSLVAPDPTLSGNIRCYFKDA